MEKVYSFGRHSSDPNIQVHLWNGKEAVYRSTCLKDAGRRKEEHTGGEWEEREHRWGKNTEKAQKYHFNIFLLESNIIIIFISIVPFQHPRSIYRDKLGTWLNWEVWLNSPAQMFFLCKRPKESLRGYMNISHKIWASTHTGVNSYYVGHWFIRICLGIEN